MRVPTENGGKVEKLKITYDTPDPLPGFYRAVFVNSYKLFTGRQSVIGLIFIAILVVIQFFTIYLNFLLMIPTRSGGTLNIFIPFGFAMGIITWGILFWYYAEIIESTAFDVEQLPRVYLEGWKGLLGKTIKYAYTFFIAMFVVELPCVIATVIFKMAGIGMRWPLYALAIFGAFLFPMAVLTVSIGRDIAMLARVDQFFSPIAKAFWPYLILAVLLTATMQLQWITPNYGKLGDSSKGAILLYLLANIGIQALAIVTMRAIGIFHRHYKCYLKW